ncbi:GldG family protein [Tundrisphaera lichenicola]|uniref:GldG family protein n=1 Tax=Tundrisphaera lichenicola TaxID=2029860 RepID=UPI003EC088E7
MSQRLIDFLSRPEVWAIASALVGFLTLTWAIRGAPIGRATREESEESPGSGYRDRVVAVSVIGFLLVLVGAYLAAAVGIPWSLPAFAAGFGTVLAVLRFNRKYRHVSPTLRRVVEFSNSALTVSLLAGILVVGNVAAFKYGGRAIDLTRDRAFSLSSLTINQLKALDRPVSFTVFFGNSENSARQLDRVRQMLDLYHAANPSLVRVEYLNPYLDVKEFEALVERVPSIVAAPGDGIVVTYGDGEDPKPVVIGTRELFEGQGSRFEPGPNRFVSTFNGEDVITSTLTRLQQGKRSKIAFSVGHGETPMGEIDPARPGLGLWRARLISAGTDPTEVNLEREDVPADISLLVICAPKKPFQSGEIDRLRQLVTRGGQLLILLGNADPSGLDDLLRTYNIELGTGVIVDPRYNYLRRGLMVFAPIVGGGAHPIVEPFAGRAALVQDAAPIEVLGGPPKPGSPPAKKASNPGVVATPFLLTSPQAWAESDPRKPPFARDPAREPGGPLAVGVAVSIRPGVVTEPPTPRMVVFSSPHVADNSIIQIEPTNLDLLMNAIFWLKGRPELIGIAAKTHESLVFAADPGLQFRLVMVPTLMAVVLIIGLGATTYVARRD